MLDLSCLMQLHSLDRPDLKDRPWPPITAGRIAVAEETDRPIVSVVRDRALLLHHPYESYASSVETFIAQVADDPRVQSIKMTLYRAGGDSAIIRSLIRAAERGVQVAVLVELKARFDEATNVQWAKQLERAGVHVVYGMVGLKTHCKVALVVRDDGDQLRRYCHIGTGNYNSRTARLYEDLGYITCDNDIGADATQLFNHLTGYSRSEEYRTLLVAPRDLRRQLLDLIEHEASFGAEGHIVFKCNSITDRTMIDALYEASAAGTRIDLIAAWHLLRARRRARVVGDDPGAQPARSLPRAQPHLPVRPRRRRRRSDPPDRVGRPDAAQPRPPGRGAGADRPPQAPRVARPGARLRARRRHRAVGAATRQRVGSGSARPTRSSRTPRTACTAGPPNASRPCRRRFAEGRRRFADTAFIRRTVGNRRDAADLPSVPHLFTFRSARRGKVVTFVPYGHRVRTDMSRLNGAKSVNFSSKRLFATAIVACLALAACGDDDDAASDTTSPARRCDRAAPPSATEPAAEATEPPADATEPAADGTEPPATGVTSSWPPAKCSSAARRRSSRSRSASASWPASCRVANCR